MLHRNRWRKILRSFSIAPRRFRAAEVVNRDRSSEGQSYQRHLRDGGHGVRGSITGGKDHQRRDRASPMRVMPNRNVRIGSQNEPATAGEGGPDKRKGQQPD